MYPLSSGSIVVLTILNTVIKQAIMVTVLHVEAAGKGTPARTLKIL